MKKLSFLVLIVCVLFNGCATLELPKKESLIDSIIVLNLEYNDSSEVSNGQKYFFIEINNGELIQIKPGLNAIKVSDPNQIVITFIGMKSSISKYGNWLFELDEDVSLTPDKDRIIILKKKVMFGIKWYQSTGYFYGSYKDLTEQEIKGIEKKVRSSQKDKKETLEFIVQ